MKNTKPLGMKSGRKSEMRTRSKCKEKAVKGNMVACPKCGGRELQISGGDALRIKELEVA